jgi:hypothetical protein
MSLLKNGINLSEALIDFISGSENLFIFVPYIKLEPLKHLLASTKNCKAIIVRWEEKDLILQSSDLEIYEYCKERGITLYRNPRLHLKVFVDDYKKGILGSPNISARALNLPEMFGYNYELATTVERFSIDDRLYFSVILNESMLITDSIYEQLKAQLPEKKKEFPEETEFQFTLQAPDKHFLISALPMTYNVKTLIRVCETRETVNEVELNCAMHDLALYDLPLGLTPDILTGMLKRSFFGHPFIKGFLSNLNANGEIYFGEAKEWIHKNCTDVPTPRKWEITENIQILYRWVVELGDGEYAIDRPNYSERLFKR